MNAPDNLPSLGEWAAVGNQTYAMKVAFTSDGRYDFTFKTTDKAGNESELHTISLFIIDTTAPVVTTNAPTTSVTIWQTTTVSELTVWNTPLTDTLSLTNIEKYYKTFDYDCVSTYSGVDLITYVQSYIKRMPGISSQSYGSRFKG